MKLGITGAASYRDYDHFTRVLNAISVPVTLIVTGGRDGVEKMARRYGREHEIPTLLHYQKATESPEPLLAFHALLMADADNVLGFHYVGTHTAALLKGVATRSGKRLNMVYLEPDHVPQSIAGRYGEEI